MIHWVNPRLLLIQHHGVCVCRGSFLLMMILNSQLWCLRLLTRHNAPHLFIVPPQTMKIANTVALGLAATATAEVFYKETFDGLAPRRPSQAVFYSTSPHIFT